MSESRYSFKTQSIGLSSVANARELGGYVLPDGRTIKRGLLLRGATLNRLSDIDYRKLVDEYKVSMVFDFRTKLETDKAPDMEIEGVTRMWLPAFNEDTMKLDLPSLPKEAFKDMGKFLIQNASNPGIQAAARDIYAGMVLNEFTQVQYAGFLQNIVSNQEGAIYWHCSQGKDRTGLGAAVLLTALGADRKLIMEDFSISNEFYAFMLDPLICQVHTPEEKAVLQTFIGVNCDYFSEALDMIEKEYGSLMDYVKGPLCMSDNDIETLRERYLE